MLQRKVYRTTLRPERRAEYIEAHRTFSKDLLRRYRDAGMTTCAVYILGDDLVLITEAEDHDRVRNVLSQDVVDQAWQAYVGPMKAEGDWQEMEEMFFADLTKVAVSR